jgi:hypothetical protein
VRRHKITTDLRGCPPPRPRPGGWQANGYRGWFFGFLVDVHAFGLGTDKPEIWRGLREFDAYFGAARVTATDASYAATPFRPILWILDNKHLPYCHRGC